MENRPGEGAGSAVGAGAADTPGPGTAGRGAAGALGGNGSDSHRSGDGSEVMPRGSGERFPGTDIPRDRGDGGAEIRAVLLAAEALRREIAALSLPFDLPEVEELRQERQRLLTRLDAYVLPRLRRMDAPLLVVIGGSTGAGKSTLTNSLVGLEISPTGVLRPTTRSPVLVHHPKDMGAFQSRRILPKLSRRTMSGSLSLEDEATRRPTTGSILLVPHESVPPGLAVIDSPDLDSHVEANRELAAQLFEVADLWVFVTTGTDYADMVPWELLAEAVEREVSVAVVLDRMRESEIAAVRVHFATMLRDRGLAAAPLFTIPETVLIGGMLPYRVIAPLQRWLTDQATDVVTRGGHVGRAVRGALDTTLVTVPQFTAATADQALVSRGARADLEAAFTRAVGEVWRGLGDGSLIDATVQAGWQELAGQDTDPGGDGGRLRRRMQVALRGHSRYQSVSDAVGAGVVRLLVTGVDDALRGALRAWAQRAEAAAALAQHPELARRSRDFTARANAALRQWQAEVLDELDLLGSRSRPSAEPAVVALVCLVVGADSGWVGPVARRLLAAEAPGLDVDARVRSAREQLHRHLRDLLVIERSRVEDVLDEAAGNAVDADGLNRAAERLRGALVAAGIGPADAGPAPKPT